MRMAWSRLSVLVLVMILAGGGAALAQKKSKSKTPPTPPPQESEYAARYRGAEAALVGIDRPYLVLDLAKSRLRLILRGVIVREYKFTLLGDSDDAKAFASLAAATDTVPKKMVRMHVFDSERQLNDTVLGIVAEATTAPADLLQRYRPGRIAVTFSDRLALDIRAADIIGKPYSWKDNLAESMRLFADDLFGGECLAIQISRDDAMSFYGVCQSAPPLLVAP
jgi:hypothetical protein